MTGPEHYQMAQELLAAAGDAEIKMTTDLGQYPAARQAELIDTRNAAIAAAQVHATLAMVALKASVTDQSKALDAAWLEAGAW